MSTRALVNVYDALDSTSATDALSANQGRVLDGKIADLSEAVSGINTGANVLVAKLGANITDPVASQYTTMTLELSNSEGDKLSVVDGKVVIGSGVTKVLVNCNLKIVCGSLGNKHARIYKNTTAVGWSNKRAVAENDEFTLSITPLLVDVTEGDTLSMAYYLATGDGISTGYHATYMTVQVVG